MLTRPRTITLNCARSWLLLARQKPRYGYRRLCALLERGGSKASPQRVYRISKRDVVNRTGATPAACWGEDED